MSKGKLIKVCGECANYDWKKHRCKLGCNEGEPQEPFYSDCPLPTIDTDQICKQTEWISVDERLPSCPSERVLVFLKEDDFTKPIGDNKIDTDRFVDSKWVRWGRFVTHWMLLPEPPKMNGA